MKRLLAVFLLFLLAVAAACTPSNDNDSKDTSSIHVDSSTDHSSFEENSDEISEVEISDAETSEIDFSKAVINNNHPIVIYEKYQFNDETIIRAYLMGGSKDGVFYSLYQYTYNGELLKYTGLFEEQEVESDLLKNNDLLRFFNKNTDEEINICEKLILYYEDGPMLPFFIPQLAKNIELPDFNGVGVSCDWEVFPRKSLFEENRAVVDIDGNGVSDEITWSVLYNEELDFDETVLRITYNEKEYVRKLYTYLADYYTEGYSIINIMDLNGDGKMEIIERVCGYGEVNYTILNVSENGITEIISYLPDTAWYETD